MQYAQGLNFLTDNLDITSIYQQIDVSIQFGKYNFPERHKTDKRGEGKKL